MEGPITVSVAELEKLLAGFEEKKDAENIVKTLAELTERCMAQGDLANAARFLQKAADFERGRKNFTTLINLEMDIIEVLKEQGLDDRARRVQLQVKKDRAAGFSDAEKDAQRAAVAAAVAESVKQSKESPDKALEVLEDCFQRTRAIFGDSDALVVDLRAEMARVYTEDGNLEDALNELMEVRDAPFPVLKQLLDIQVRLAVELHDDNLMTDAFETLKRMKQRHRQQHGDEIDRLTAYALYRTGKLKEALMIYERILSKSNAGELKLTDSEKASIQTLTAKVLHDLERFGEALDLLKAAQALSPSARTAFLMATVLRSSKDFPGALKSLEEMEKLLEQNDWEGSVTCWKLRANLFGDTGKNQDALELLKKCQEACETHHVEHLLAGIWDDFGLIYHNLGNAEEAAKYYDLAHPAEDDEEDEDNDEE